jgi:hypothetical protein
MKHAILFAFIILISVPASAQIEWPHSDSEPGITIFRGYSYVRLTVPDNRGGMWFINQNSYSTSDTIFVVHVNSANEFRSPQNFSLIKVGARSGAGGSNSAHATAIPDGNGGIVLCYFRENGVLTAQRFNIQGQPQWGVAGASISPANFFGRSVFALYSKGNFFVGWKNYVPGVIGSIQVQRVNSNGIIQWAQEGVPMMQNNTPDNVLDVQFAEDGAGGIALSTTRNDSIFWQIIDVGGNRKYPTGLFLDRTPLGYTSNMVYSNSKDAWYIAAAVNRYGASSGSDIVLHKIQRTSDVFIAQWSADTGKLICKYPGNQIRPLLTDDGDGGMLVSWLDDRNVVQQQGTRQIFAQRWTKDEKSQWTANGVQVSSNYFSSTIDLQQPIAQKNGFIIPYFESNTGVFIQKVSMNGTLQWFSPIGKVHSLLNFSSWKLFDVNGNNFLFVYGDIASLEVNIKLVDGNGYLGDNTPRLDKSKDVINDQGGKISVLFRDSWQELNAAPNQQGGSRTYRLYRGITERNGQVGQSFAESGPSLPSTILTSTDGAKVTTAAGQTIYWELINDIAPHGLGNYSKIVSTASDSGRQGIPWHYFMVGYGNFASSPLVIWYSNVDSGYSVDNLAPFPPQMPAGLMANGAVLLHWKRNTEEDLAGYEVYRGTTPQFIPNEQNRIASTADTLYRDQNAPQHTLQYYIIKAVDVNGNSSANSALISLNVLEVSNTNTPLPTEYALDQNYPNPFNPTTNISFALPVAGFVSLRVFDALGRSVETLVNEFRSAGRYTVPFGGGHLSSGLYIGEVRTEQFTKRIKMNLIK